ncbi:putative SLC26A/SulP transporter [Helianthus anomalus]
MRKPKLFWVSAAAPLASVILSTVEKHNSNCIIGQLDKGVNPPSSNMLHFHGEFLAVAVKTGVVTGLLSSFLGVLFVSVPVGLAIAVGISVFKILLHVTRPNTSDLGNIPGTQIY